VRDRLRPLAKTVKHRRLRLRRHPNHGGHNRRNQPGSISEIPHKAFDEARTQYYLAMVYHKLGRAADAERSLQRLNVLRGGEAGDYELAAIHAQWGNTAKALGSLESALRSREQDLMYLKVDPLLDPLRSQPRFQAIERELQFPD